MMPGLSMREVRDAILDAYDADELAESLRFLMDVRFDHVAKPAAFPTRVFQLLEWADRQGRGVELVWVVGRDRPHNDKLQQVLRRYGLGVAVAPQAAGVPVAGGPADAAAGGLQEIVRPHLRRLPDFGLWRAAMARVEGQVCRVTLNGNAQGTGFLVGPDAVLTNFHVLEPVIRGRVPAAAAECQFDFKLLADGTSPYTPVRLAADWDIDHSPYTAGEAARTPDATVPTPDELDYALVRLAEPVGARPWARSPDAGGNAPARGWVRVPDAAPALPPRLAVVIAQHPRGLPMKLAVDTDAIDQAQGRGLNPAGTRVRYATNTEGGSSGSPCFDFDWNLIALHHYGDPAYGHPPAWNQGVPIGLVRGRLARQGKAAALGGDPT